MNVIRLLDRPIAFHRCLVETCGSINAALMLGQALYWTNRIPPDRQGWFYKTAQEWTEETGLTRYEQESARKLLKARKLLEEKLEGVPATLHFRVVESSLLENLKLDSGKPTNLNAVKPQTPNSTETTQEITHQKAGGECISEIKQSLCQIFKRDPSARWGYDEEFQLVEVSARPDVTTELRLIEKWYPTVERRYAPQTILKLLSDWNGCLDKARGSSDRKMTVTELKIIIQAKEEKMRDLRDEFANESALGFEWRNKDAKEAHRQLRIEVQKLKDQLASGVL